jgi:DamX protein
VPVEEPPVAIPDPEPVPVEPPVDPAPEPEPEPAPEPEPEPEPAPEPIPEPETAPEPPAVVEPPTVADTVKDALADGKLTSEEKAAVADALIAAVAPGEAVSAADIKAAGIEYKDLPPATPVEVRQDENGNEVVITAEVAAQVELLENPSELLATALSDPGAALAALGSVGADMSDEEREEATEMVVATVIAAGAAMNAVAAAGGATGGSTGGSTGGGNWRRRRWRRSIW